MFIILSLITSNKLQTNVDFPLDLSQIPLIQNLPNIMVNIISNGSLILWAGKMPLLTLCTSALVFLIILMLLFNKLISKISNTFMLYLIISILYLLVFFACTQLESLVLRLFKKILSPQMFKKYNMIFMKEKLLYYNNFYIYFLITLLLMITFSLLLNKILSFFDIF